MEKFKKFFQDLGVSGYVTLGTSGAMLLTAVVYMICYGKASGIYVNMSWPSVFALSAGAIIGAALLPLFKGKYASLAQILGGLGALFFFVNQVWQYVSAAFTGIDSQFEFKFFLVAGLIVLSLAGSVASFVMNSFANKALPKALAAAGAVVVTIAAVGGGIANESASAINGFLGTSPYKTIKVENEGGEEEDTMYFKSDYNSIADLKAAGKALCEEAEEEGAVLLKNLDVAGESRKALPLTSGKKVTLFSVNSVKPIYSGTGSGSVKFDPISFKDALSQKAGLVVNETVWNWYSDNYDTYKPTFGSTGAGVSGPRTLGEPSFSDLETATGSSWAGNDAAIVVISRSGGEGSDSPRGILTLNKMTDVDGSAGDTTDGDYLKLSPREIELFKGLKAKKEAGVFKEVVVLLNFANQVEASFLEDPAYGIDAALWMATPGETGINGVADLIGGNANPSGRLSTTFWADHHQNPALSNFGVNFYEGMPEEKYMEDGSPNQDRTYVVYQEGIYLGYKYTESRYEDVIRGKANVGTYDYKNVVTYPFGYGLSYTSFSYSNFSVSEGGSGNKAYYEVSVDVTNSGALSGKHAVQVYLDKPYDENNNNYNSTNKVEASASELVGFEKTKLLAPGDTQNIRVKVDKRLFASYDDTNAKTYVITGGDYYLSIGNGAHDALNNTLAKKGASGLVDHNGAAVSGDATLAYKTTLAFDDVTYATSKNGTPIHNLFQESDYNHYEHKAAGDHVDYVSRSNWNETTELNWNNHVVLHYNENLQADLDKHGRQGELKVGESDRAYPTMGASNGLQLINLRADENGDPIPYNDPLWDKLLDQLTWDEMSETIRQGMRQSGAIPSIGKPLFIDHNGPTGLTEKYEVGKQAETGLAFWTQDPNKELRGTCYPSGGILAASNNKQLVYHIGEMIAQDAVWAGYSGLYGPGSNIQRTPYSGRNYEYYSEDGFLTGTIAGYECAAMEKNGLYVYNKHFGLNDQEDMRRGIMTWANEQTVREIYLRAFQLPVEMNGETFEKTDASGSVVETITMKGASGVMIAFNRVGLYWTGLTENLMSGFLRGECGMTGIAVTDMWFGKTVPYLNLPAMLMAGTNLVDGGVKAEEIDGAKTGHADVAWAMRESIHRICYAGVHSIGMNGISNDTILVPVTEPWRYAVTGLQIGSALLAAGGFGWMIATAFLGKKKEVEA